MAHEGKAIAGRRFGLQDAIFPWVFAILGSVALVASLCAFLRRGRAKTPGGTVAASSVGGLE